MIAPSDNKIYTLGPEYTFSDNLARKLYPSSEICYLNSNSSLVDIASKGERVLVAIENSVDSIVGETLKKVREKGNINIAKEIYYPIIQCLGGVKGAKEKDLRVVYSHQKALAQTLEYLNKLSVTYKETNSTAEAAEIVNEFGEYSIGVVGSEESINYCGLELLRKNIQEKSAYTTFWELGRKKGDGDHTALIIDLKEDSGALYKFLEPIYKQELNLYALHSWPENGGYWFLIKIEESEKNIDFNQLNKETEEIRNLGSYNIIDFR